MWFLYVSISGLVSSALRLLNRFILRDEENTIGFAFISKLIVCMLLIPLLFIVPRFEWPKTIFPYITVLISGLLSGIFYVLVMKAVGLMEASVSNVVYQTKNIYSLILGALFLGESTSLLKIVGIMLIILAAILPNFEIKKLKKLKLEKGFIYVQFSAVTASVGIVLDKYALSFFPVPMFIIIVSVVSLLFLLTFFVKKPYKQIKYFTRKSNRLALFAGLLHTISTYFMVWSVSLGEISKIMPIKEAFIILTIIGGIFLLNEKNRIPQKIFAALIAFFGVLLVKNG